MRRLSQPFRQSSPKVMVSLDWISRISSDLQFANALLPIFFTLSGSTATRSCSQPSKAPSPMASSCSEVPSERVMVPSKNTMSFGTLSRVTVPFTF